jgi:hypothetical protein
VTTLRATARAGASNVIAIDDFRDQQTNALVSNADVTVTVRRRGVSAAIVTDLPVPAVAGKPGAYAVTVDPTDWPVDGRTRYTLTFTGTAAVGGDNLIWRETLNVTGSEK